jgi:hypothetical protein
VFCSLGEARQRALGKARQKMAEQNRHKALRLYEEGLRRGDPSAVDEVVSKDFRDLGGGHRGKQGVELYRLGAAVELPRPLCLSRGPGDRGRLGQDAPYDLGHGPGQRGYVVPANGTARKLRGRACGSLFGQSVG